MATTLRSDFEYLSALMDGENLSAEAVDRLLADEKAAQAWHEYHVIRDTMKAGGAVKEVNFTADSAFAAKLAAVSAEHRNHARKPAAAQDAPFQTASAPAANQTAFRGWAVAASIAAVAVSVWQLWPQTETAQQAPAVAAEEAKTETAKQSAPAASEQAKPASAPAQTQTSADAAAQPEVIVEKPSTEPGKPNPAQAVH